MTARTHAQGVDFVPHEAAALSSAPPSPAGPITTDAVNIDGFLNMLITARDARVERFFYTGKQARYDDHPACRRSRVAVAAECGDEVR